MNPWSNIAVAPDDPEIAEIDQQEASLDKIPVEAKHIRELITGFEVCHFKYKKHLEYLKNAISTLKPAVNLHDVGSHHIRMGDRAWQSDPTGRSLVGQQFITAIDTWLGEKKADTQDETSDPERTRRVCKALGTHESEKDRLVRLLKARLLWDWDTYNNLYSDKEDNVLESQVCRMDICHYAFPEHVQILMGAIGRLEYLDCFEGCGTYNHEIKKHVDHEITRLIQLSESLGSDDRPDEMAGVKRWLLSCLIKTIRAQTTG